MPTPRRADSGQLMTMREVCSYLRLSRSGVYKLIRGGRLEVVRIGSRSIRFRKAQVDAFVAAIASSAKRRREWLDAS